MIIKDRIFDHRIDSLNLLIETNLEEYFNLSKGILRNNELQRRRVKSSSSVYSLLKNDIRAGCVIPPIVLALSMEAKPEKAEENIDDETLINRINQNQEKLVILDGLQRTYTIRDLITELNDLADPDKEEILKRKLRIEIYIGLNKLGILYRMLTLNTGQTPMSSRHQIEIIYSDYTVSGLDGIRLIREVDGGTPATDGEYAFRDIIDGFTSFLERDYLTLDRTDILDNIKSLEKLATTNKSSDLFVEFVTTYHAFAKKMNGLGRDWSFREPESTSSRLSRQPFAREALKIFNKSQVMTGFGSALGKLIDFNLVKDIPNVGEMISRLESNSINDDLDSLILKLDNISRVSKKIGNDQRLFFHHFFRALFNSDSDGFLNLGESINEAYRQYERMTQ